MVKIKPESQINENELLSKSLICRQNIVRELRNNKENFNGIIRIYKDYINVVDANKIPIDLPGITQTCKSIVENTDAQIKDISKKITENEKSC